MGSLDWKKYICFVLLLLLLLMSERVAGQQSGAEIQICQAQNTLHDTQADKEGYTRHMYHSWLKSSK